MLTVNEHLAGLIRYGPAPMWSDACFPLVETLRKQQPAIVFAADWGMGDTMRMYLRHKIPVRNGIEPFSRQELDEFQRRHILRRISTPGSVFVSYVDSRDVFPQAKRLIAECAQANGYRRETLALVHDRRQRPVFEVYRFVPPKK